MALEISPLHSRRAVLAGALGGLAVWAASATGRPLPAHADGETIHVGGVYNDASSVTKLKNHTNNQQVFSAESTAGGIAVEASSSGLGVYGFSSSNIGVYARSDATNRPAMMGQSFGNYTGVQGYSGGSSEGIPAKARTGVYGSCDEGHTAKGVWGASLFGSGVYGQSRDGYGGVFNGGKAQLRLVPGPALSHPSSGQPGDLFVDKSHRLWFCKGGTTWVHLA